MLEVRVAPRKCAPLLACLLLLAPARVPMVAAQERAPEPGYLDDRSTPEAVIRSYYDAVSKHEYARAYSYWEPPAAERELPDFDAFASGYAETASFDLTIGAGGGGVGAGQLFFTVPVALVAQQQDGSTQTFVGCYTLHLGRPQLQAAPPFQPMSIQHASIQQVDNDSPISELLASACPP